MNVVGEQIDFLFDDLTLDSQRQLLKLYRVKGAKEMNWDSMPVVSLPLPELPEPNYFIVGERVEFILESKFSAYSEKKLKEELGDEVFQMWAAHDREAGRLVFISSCGTFGTILFEDGDALSGVSTAHFLKMKKATRADIKVVVDTEDKLKFELKPITNVGDLIDFLGKAENMPIRYGYGIMVQDSGEEFFDLVGVSFCDERNILTFEAGE